MLLSCLPQLVKTSAAILALKAHSSSDPHLCFLLIPNQWCVCVCELW